MSKMSTSKEDYLEWALKCFRAVGLESPKRNLRQMFFIHLMLPINLIFAGMILLELKDAHGSIAVIAAVFESLSTFGQLFARKFVLFFHAKKFYQICQDRKIFWDYDMYGEELGNRFRKNLKLCQNLVKLLIAVVFSTMIILVLLTVFTDKDLPEASWIPKNDPNYKKVLYTCEIIFFAEILVFVGAFDGFFVITCYELTAQFHLLNLEIESAIKGNSLERLKKCASHHYHLISVHHKLSKAYSEYFIVQYLITVMAICIQFFLILDKSTGIDQILKSLFYLGAVCTQVSLFFFPSTIISDEAEKVSEVLFNSQWYLSDSIELRKHVLFMLMKAQDVVEMSGGGLFYINRSQYLGIYRISFSIATIMGSTR